MCVSVNVSVSASVCLRVSARILQEECAKTFVSVFLCEEVVLVCLSACFFPESFKCEYEPVVRHDIMENNVFNDFKAFLRSARFSVNHHGENPIQPLPAKYKESYRSVTPKTS